MTQTIKLSGRTPFQSIDVGLSGNFVTIRLSYVTLIDAWAMDIYQSGVPLYAGIMLRSNADMLQSWNVRETFGAMTLIGAEPTFDNLGEANVLVWTPPDEL
jgi:hypothetical protein